MSSQKSLLQGGIMSGEDGWGAPGGKGEESSEDPVPALQRAP